MLAAVVFAVTLVSAGCSFVHAAPPDQPAVIPHGTDQATAAVAAALEELLPGSRFATDVFRTRATVTLEPPVRQRLEGEIGLARNVGKPVRVSLVLREDGCYVVSGERSVPVKVDCQPVETVSR